MSDHTIEWSPAPRQLDPEIATAVDVVEARLFTPGNFLNVIAAESHMSALDNPVSADDRLAAVEKIRASREARLVPIRYESDGAPIYAHQIAPYREPIINSRDCELAGFDLADVLAAARLYAR